MCCLVCWCSPSRLCQVAPRRRVRQAGLLLRSPGRPEIFSSRGPSAVPAAPAAVASSWISTDVTRGLCDRVWRRLFGVIDPTPGGRVLRPRDRPGPKIQRVEPTCQSLVIRGHVRQGRLAHCASEHRPRRLRCELGTVLPAAQIAGTDPGTRSRLHRRRSAARAQHHRPRAPPGFLPEPSATSRPARQACPQTRACPRWIPAARFPESCCLSGTQSETGS